MWADEVTVLNQTFNGTSEAITDYGFSIASSTIETGMYTKITDGRLVIASGGYRNEKRFYNVQTTFDQIISDDITVSLSWFTGWADGISTHGEGYSKFSIGDGSHQAIEILYYGNGNNDSNIAAKSLLINGTVVAANVDKNQTFDVTIKLNAAAKRITSVQIGNLTLSSTSFDFKNADANISQFNFEYSRRQNDITTSSIDDLVIKYNNSQTVHTTPKEWDFSKTWGTNLSNLTYGFGFTARSTTEGEKAYTNFQSIGIVETDELQFNGTIRIRPESTNGYIRLFPQASVKIPVKKDQIVNVDANGYNGIRSYLKITNTDNSENLINVKDAGSFYITAKSDGYITIYDMPKSESGNKTEAHLIITKITIEDKPDIHFSTDHLTAYLTNFNVTNEPTLTYPSGATVSYYSSNTKIAKVSGEGGNHDVMCINGGLTTIYADVIYKGTVYEQAASYSLTVSADPDATYSISNDNKTFTFTGKGKLGTRVITEVTNMVMEFGENDNTLSPRNITVVGDNLGSRTIDQNGWQQLWFISNNEMKVIPYQGTFYTFKPKGKGKLSVTGNITNENNAYIVKESDLAPMPSQINGLVGKSANDWHGTGLADGEGIAPKVSVDGEQGATGTEYYLAENYKETVDELGDILYQTITGIPDGNYTVQLYANANYTPGRNIGSTSNPGWNWEESDKTDAVYVFANETKQYITPNNYSTLNSGTIGVYTLSVNVTDGIIAFGLHKDKIGTNWHTIQIKSLVLNDIPSTAFTPIATATASNPNFTDVELERNETYYLYANIPSSNAQPGWSTYELKSFTFEAEENPIYFATKSVVLKNENSFTQHAVGETVQTRYSVECKGDITCSLNETTGEISNISGDGGAIVVTAVDGDYNDYYVVTIPYKTHDWNFWTTLSTDENNDDITTTNRNWAVTYKTREYTTVVENENRNRYLTYINEPVLAIDKVVEGDNAAFISETAGLVVVGSAKSFGARASVPNLKDYNVYTQYYETVLSESEFYDNYNNNNIFKDGVNKAMLNFGLDDASNLNILSMNKGVTLTIPNLKAGQYVSIKWYRHGANSSSSLGDVINVTNLRDLSGELGLGQSYQEIPNNTVRVVTQNGSKSPETSRYGWLEFRVEEDGDASIQVADNGWTNMRRIVVTDEYMPTDLRLVINGHTASTTYYTNESVNTVINYENSNNQHQELAHSVKFYLQDEDLKTGGTATLTESGQLVLGPQTEGTATVVQVAYNNGYALEYKKTAVVFKYSTDTHQDYPYTWDLTDLSTSTKTSLTNSEYWSGNSSDGFKPNNYTITDNTELKDGVDQINEYDELAFHNDDMPNITITEGGLVIGDETEVTVPDVPSDCKVYVRVSADDNNGSVKLTNGDGTTEITSGNDVGSDKVYVINGNEENNVVITANDVTIKAIGVTPYEKETRFEDTVTQILGSTNDFYNSDCWQFDVNYDYTEYFTGEKLKALLCTGRTLVEDEYDDEASTISVTNITIVPAETGVIVYSLKDKTYNHPIFAKSINQVNEDASESMLIGITEATNLPASDEVTSYYVFTNVFNYISSPSTKETASVPGFYKVNSAGTLAAHRAYLTIDRNGSANAVKAFALRYIPKNVEEDVTGIDTINGNNLPSDGIDLNGEFYTISGVKIQGAPSQKGIYIQNGKKVMIK